MPKYTTVFMLGIALLGGCKKQAAEPANPSPAIPEAAQQGDPQADSQAVHVTEAAAVSTQPEYGQPPTVDVGLSVEQAYAAIPHRRTIWEDSDTTVPPADKEYLKVMFQVLDQGVAVRVAGLQNYSNQQYDGANIDGEFDRLISFVHTMPVPRNLATYHNEVLMGLTGQRAFFAEWKTQRDQFAFSRQIADHPGVKSASNALRSAYGELMAKYPNESPRNKDAFFDYHCALDFL